MGDIKNLTDKEAIEKIKEICDDKMCVFCTVKNNNIVSRPMSTRGVDKDGALWFISRADSEKNQQIDRNSKVYLMYMDTSKQHYLSLTGYAEIVKDRSRLDELWSPFIKTWFEEGKDDPKITLLKVTPDNGHYWDTKNGKLVSFIKIALATVTGKFDSDGSLEGDLNP